MPGVGALDQLHEDGGLDEVGPLLIDAYRQIDCLANVHAGLGRTEHDGHVLHELERLLHIILPLHGVGADVPIRGQDVLEDGESVVA